MWLAHISLADVIRDERLSFETIGLAVALRERYSRQSSADLESALRMAIAERDALARAHSVATERLEEIHASFAWRLTTALRRIIVNLLPAGTRRRRVFDSLLA